MFNCGNAAKTTLMFQRRTAAAARRGNTRRWSSCAHSACKQARRCMLSWAWLVTRCLEAEEPANLQWLKRWCGWPPGISVGASRRIGPAQRASCKHRHASSEREDYLHALHLCGRSSGADSRAMPMATLIGQFGLVNWMWSAGRPRACAPVATLLGCFVEIIPRAIEARMPAALSVRGQVDLARGPSGSTCT